MMREIGAPAAAQIIDDPNAIAAIEQMVDHVTADKAGASGDDRYRALRVHFTPSFFMVRTL